MCCMNYDNIFVIFGKFFCHASNWIDFMTNFWRDKRIIIWCEVYLFLFYVCLCLLFGIDDMWLLFSSFNISYRLWFLVCYAMLCLQFRKCLFYTIQDRMNFLFFWFWFLCFICSYFSPQFYWIHELSIIHEIVGLKILFYDIKNKSIIEHK